MTGTRYFKGTDGERTVFRASTTRAYLSASIYPSGTISFNGRPVGAGGGMFPVVEITTAEYAALVKAKAARIERVKAEIASRDDRTAEFWRECNFRGFASGPQDSWVFNSEIEERST